jgi:Ca2+-transporting ATPase
LVNHSEIDSLYGLSEDEAARKLRDEGYNELPSSKRRGFPAIALDVVREPMFLLLVACGAIYLVIGDLREALMLLGFVLVVMGITFYQERKTERTLEALRDLSSPRALVIREGKQKRIPGREVVCGDILILSEGDRVPADAMLLSVATLSADESLLTGESAPVRKSAEAGIAAMGRPGGDDLPFVYSSTLIVQGQGVARVQATGMQTEIGKIGRSLQILEAEETPLKRETSVLVRKLAIAGLSLCALVVIVYGLTRGNWLDGLLAGIAMAMAMLPEEFPVVLTVFLAIGAWRIAKNNVLTRRVPAVEALGATTVLCVDKTGTLTMNRMSVQKVFANGEYCEVTDYRTHPPPETFHDLLEFSILASQKDPFDPMEKAFHEFARDRLEAADGLPGPDWKLTHSYGLRPDLLAMTQLWQKDKGTPAFVVAAKGAPEAIGRLCGLGQSELDAVRQAVDAMAAEGLRVLGVAKAAHEGELWPESQHDFGSRFSA